MPEFFKEVLKIIGYCIVLDITLRIADILWKVQLNKYYS